MNASRPVTGGCLCAKVRYEVDAFTKPASHCHCEMCRKHHGAAFATYGSAVAGAFRYTDGESLVRVYTSSTEYQRSFCSNCGSTLSFGPTSGGRVAVALGTVDGDPGIRADRHIFVSSKVPWLEINDDLEQHHGYDR